MELAVSGFVLDASFQKNEPPKTKRLWVEYPAQRKMKSSIEQHVNQLQAQLQAQIKTPGH
jgi:hypothetical protein